MRAALLDNPDLPLADIMRRWPETVTVFIAHKMLCVGCVIGPFHSIDDACAEYGIDPDALLAELHAAVRAAAGPAGQADEAARR